MPSNKDRLKELANTSRRIARRMTTQSVADRFDAMADEYDRQAEEASGAEIPETEVAMAKRRPFDGQGASE